LPYPRRVQRKCMDGKPPPYTSLAPAKAGGFGQFDRVRICRYCYSFMSRRLHAAIGRAKVAAASPNTTTAHFPLDKPGEI
jgi:hypothetical protein